MPGVENGLADAIYRVREDVWVGTPTLDHVDIVVAAAAGAPGDGAVHATAVGAHVANTVATADVVGVMLDAATERDNVVQLQERHRDSTGRVERSRAKRGHGPAQEVQATQESTQERRGCDERARTTAALKALA